MKYLVFIALIAGGYYYYQNQNPSLTNTNGSIVEVIQRNGHISAGKILEKSQDMVLGTCKDDEILRTWGSSAEECHARIAQFEDMCQSRIFPDLSASYSDKKSAVKLSLRYVDCLLPRAG